MRCLGRARWKNSLKSGKWWKAWWEKRRMITQHQIRIRWSSHCGWNLLWLLLRLLIAWVISTSSGWVTETFVLRQRSHSAETLSALITLNLHTTISVHTLMTTQVRELGVGFEADLALERLHRRMDVRMLLKSWWCREGFSAFRARVTSRSNVVLSNMSL